MTKQRIVDRRKRQFYWHYVSRSIERGLLDDADTPILSARNVVGEKEIVNNIGGWEIRQQWRSNIVLALGDGR